MNRDHEHPFFRPLWRRMSVVVVSSTKDIWEVMIGREGLWTALAVGMTAYAAWTFLITYPKPDEQKKE